MFFNKLRGWFMVAQSFILTALKHQKELGLLGAGFAFFVIKNFIPIKNFFSKKKDKSRQLTQQPYLNKGIDISDLAEEVSLLSKKQKASLARSDEQSIKIESFISFLHEVRDSQKQIINFVNERIDFLTKENQALSRELHETRSQNEKTAEELNKIRTQNKKDAQEIKETRDQTQRVAHERDAARNECQRNNQKILIYTKLLLDQSAQRSLHHGPSGG
jgi:chromosome segregation ATPase